MHVSQTLKVTSDTHGRAAILRLCFFCLSRSHSSRILDGCHDLLDVERLKRVSTAANIVELALELHPVQAERMQETFPHVHTKEHCERHGEPSCEHAVEHDPVYGVRHFEPHLEGLREEHHRKLLVREGQCPNTQIRRSVGDRT